MDFIGLLVELLLFGLGLYFYLFVTNRIKFKDREAAEKAAAFRENNGTWVRLLSLALMAVMLVNIIVHLQQLFG